MRTYDRVVQAENMGNSSKYWDAGATCISNELIEKYPADAVGIIAKIAAGQNGSKYRSFDELLKSLEPDTCFFASWLIQFQKDKLLLVADVMHDEHLSLLNYKDLRHAGQVMRIFWFFEEPYTDEVLRGRSVNEYLSVPGARVMRVEEALCDYDFTYIELFGMETDVCKFHEHMNNDYSLFMQMMKQAPKEELDEAKAFYRTSVAERRYVHD